VSDVLAKLDEDDPLVGVGLGAAAGVAEATSGLRTATFPHGLDRCNIPGFY
jgi:hypothetical protein